MQGVVNILEAVLEAGLGNSARLFEASSCEMFDGAQGSSCDEESAIRPRTPYGKAKMLAYLTVRHYRCSQPLDTSRHSLALRNIVLRSTRVHADFARFYLHAAAAAADDDGLVFRV